ncbi:unnamed protein product [marine sediment metagenome]|uniref:Uncharacterized protein n=1 Tax=marine sediment metagenome TaxID=412755 RepID=X1UNU3_9ZZZZ
MNITGLKVIRGNPGAPKSNPGIATGVLAGERIELTYGDTLISSDNAISISTSGAILFIT